MACHLRLDNKKTPT